MYLPLKDISKLRRGDLLRRGDQCFVVSSICGTEITAVSTQRVLDESGWEVWEEGERPLAPVIVMKKVTNL